MNDWDPQRYDAAFGFVTRLGGDLVDELAPRRGERILDVGCGTGHLTARLAAAGAVTVGVDRDEGMLRRAAHAHPGLRWVAADAQDLSAALPGEQFDAAFSNAALHWMPQQAAALTGVRSVLRVSGRFVAEMGGAGNVAAVDAAFRGALADCGLAVAVPHNFFPTLAEESVLLEAANFRVESMVSFDRPTPLDAGLTVADWVQHFRAGAWTSIPPPDRPRVADRLLVRAAAAGLHSDGGWHVDYRRLRWRAVAV